MASNIKGEVPVTVDGKVWILLFDFNAMCAFEEETGVNPIQFMEDCEPQDYNPSPRLVRDFIWAALLERQPDATKKDAGRILSSDADALSRVFAAALPDPQSAEPGADAPGEGTATTP